MTRGQRPVFVAFRNEHKRPVERQDLVQEHRDVHRARLRHAVVARPGAVILMPLPHVAFESGLGIELELVDVDVLAEDLPHRLDQPRVPGEESEYIAEGMRGEGRSRRAGFFPPDLLPVERKDALGFVAQKRDLFLAETIREEEKTLLFKFADLFGAEVHAFLPTCPARSSLFYLTWWKNPKANAGVFRGMLQQQEKCGEKERHGKRYPCEFRKATRHQR